MSIPWPLKINFDIRHYGGWIFQIDSYSKDIQKKFHMPISFGSLIMMKECQETKF